MVEAEKGDSVNAQDVEAYIKTAHEEGFYIAHCLPTQWHTDTDGITNVTHFFILCHKEKVAQ